jgi:hypothetical protein
MKPIKFTLFVTCAVLLCIIGVIVGVIARLIQYLLNFMDFLINLLWSMVRFFDVKIYNLNKKEKHNEDS